MIAGGSCPGEGQAALISGCGCLGIQVENYLHVIGHEADRHRYHGGYATRGEVAQMIVDVRLQPSLTGGTGS
jgi:hypothetical protein